MNYFVYNYLGSCSNFSGCCDDNVEPSCRGSDGICYCDQSCYSHGDCCFDIQSIGCYACMLINDLMRVISNI